MTVTINGTTGITNDGGYTGDGVVFADTTPANTLVTTNSGNVGIGTSLPTARVSAAGVAAAIQVTLVPEQGAATDYLMGTGYNVSHDGSNWQTQLAGSNGGAFIGSNWGDGALRFYTIGNTASGNRTFSNAQFAALERARIDSSGNLLVGTTTSQNAVYRVQAENSSTAGQYTARSTTAAVGKFWHFGASANAFIIYNQADVGQYMVDGATSWTANSDERLKTTLKPFENAVQKVATLRAGTGRYLTDEESVSRSFLIAQDVQKVLPEAVDVQSDEQGTLGLRYQDLTPLLVAAIQEQQTLIQDQLAIILAQESALNALTARVAALEGTQP